MTPLERLNAVVVNVDDDWVLYNDFGNRLLLGVFILGFVPLDLTVEHLGGCLPQFVIEIDWVLLLGSICASQYFWLVVHRVFWIWNGRFGICSGICSCICLGFVFCWHASDVVGLNASVVLALWQRSHHRGLGGLPALQPLDASQVAFSWCCNCAIVKRLRMAIRHFSLSWEAFFILLHLFQVTVCKLLYFHLILSSAVILGFQELVLQLEKIGHLVLLLKHLLVLHKFSLRRSSNWISEHRFRSLLLSKIELCILAYGTVWLSKCFSSNWKLWLSFNWQLMISLLNSYHLLIWKISGYIWLSFVLLSKLFVHSLNVHGAYLRQSSAREDSWVHNFMSIIARPFWWCRLACAGPFWWFGLLEYLTFSIIQKSQILQRFTTWYIVIVNSWFSQHTGVLAFKSRFSIQLHSSWKDVSLYSALLKFQFILNLFISQLNFYANTKMLLDRTKRYFLSLFLACACFMILFVFLTKSVFECICFNSICFVLMPSVEAS